MILINLDFTNGNEVSMEEGWELLENKQTFITCCTNFFSTDTECEVIVVRKDGSYVSKNDLMENNDDSYTPKEIRQAHNIEKILRANGLDFKKLPESVIGATTRELYLKSFFKHYLKNNYQQEQVIELANKLD